MTTLMATVSPNVLEIQMENDPLNASSVPSDADSDGMPDDLDDDDDNDNFPDDFPDCEEEVILLIGWRTQSICTADLPLEPITRQ